MNFLNPIAFWGLLGLLVPTLILLLSKKKQDVVEFGSLSFLLASESQSAKAIYPTQWLQYLLRIGLLSILILLIARPVFKSKSDHLVYIEDEVYHDASFASELRLINEKSKVEIFKYTNNSMQEAQYFPSAWILINNLNRNGDSVTVYTYNLLKHFIGEEVPIREGIEWKVWPSKSVLVSTDTIAGRNVERSLTTQSDEQGLLWTSEEVKVTGNNKEDLLKVNVESSSRSIEQKEKLLQILDGFTTILPLDYNFDSAGDIDWTIAMDTSMLQYNGGLIEWSTIDQPLTLERLGKELIQVKGSLSVDRLMGSNFPLELADIIMGKKLTLSSLDRRVAPIPEISKKVEDSVLKAQGKERKYYWWSLIILILLLERWRTFKSSRS